MYSLVAAVLLALTASEWLALVTILVGPGLIANILLVSKALRTMRREKTAGPMRERTVVWNEVEGTFRILHSTIEQQNYDLNECRDHLADARAWRREHIEQCPQYQNGRGRGGR